MSNVPEGYTYKRCDRYTPEEFLAMYKSRDMKRVCREYIQENPKDIYTTDDQIALHERVRDRQANSLQRLYGRKTTKRFKSEE